MREDGRFKISVQVPAIETCFMSIDEILVAQIKSQSPYKRGKLRFFPCTIASENMKTFF